MPTFEKWLVLQEEGEVIISFSHFVPHVELNPEKRYLFFPNLNKAVGSNFLRERVEVRESLPLPHLLQS